MERSLHTENIYARQLRSLVKKLGKELSTKSTIKQLKEFKTKLDKLYPEVERIVEQMIKGQIRQNKREWMEDFENIEDPPALKLKRQTVKEVKEMIDKIYEKAVDNLKKLRKDQLLAIMLLLSLSKKDAQKFINTHKDKTNQVAQETNLVKKNMKRATVTANSENGRLHTSLTRMTSKNLGIKAYIWLAELDNVTRFSHAKMHNVIVFWGKKPTPGIYEPKYKNKRKVDAGEDYNCRCTPEPIITAKQLDNIAVGGYVKYWSNGIRKMKLNTMKERLGV